MRSAPRVPAPALVLLGIGSVQIGSALARRLFERIGPEGTVALRTLFAAAVVLAIARPRIQRLTRAQLAVVVAFGVSLAAMNFLFYEALARIPLGVAVSLEFVGPLGVAVAGSRRRLDFAWVVAAAAGVLLLAHPGGGSLALGGTLLALGAGAFWAAYIVLSARTGAAVPGAGGLAVALAIAAALLLPVGIAHAGSQLLGVHALALGAVVAMLSSAIPYSLELEALRHLPARVFGVLLSLEPAVAALAGFAILDQVLSARELTGIALVVVASAGAATEGGGAQAPLDA
jgi:inner membrane transporter RhtA